MLLIAIISARRRWRIRFSISSNRRSSASIACARRRLIFFGSEDRTVPVHQGWVQYRALQQLGKTDVRFVLFPGEKHILTKLAHQRRKVKEELAWLDR